MVQQFETILPEDFDGTFRFTNATDEDFIGKWGNKQYLFPAQKTTPMLILDATPLEVQQIRKKFARDLGEREFFKSRAGQSMQMGERNADGSARFNSIHMAVGYTDADIAPFVQACLRPLAAAKATVQDSPKENFEDKLAKNDDGEIVTEAIDKKTSLRKKALEAGNK